jgi:hypothetical protein
MQITSTDRQVLKKIDQDQIEAGFLASVAHFVGLAPPWFGTPGSASPSPGAITLSASFAGWVDGFLQNFARKTRSVELATQSTLRMHREI